MRKLKITLLTMFFPYPHRGSSPGVERSVEEIALNLQGLGYNVKIVTTYLNGGKRRDNYKGLEILRINEPQHIIGRLGAFMAFNRVVFGLLLLRPKNFKFIKDSDILVMYNPGLCSPLLSLLNIPLISMFWHFTFPIFFITKWEFKHNKNIITVSNQSKKDLIKYYGTKKEWIKVIPNGINLEKFSPSNNSPSIRKKYGKNIILYSGLMEPRKRVTVLLKSMKYIIKDIPNVNLVLTGYGSKLEDYKDLAKDLDINKNTHFLGFVRDRELVKLYATSDLFVFPSVLEGFGQILVEAMASGTPVICANKPPMSEIVGDGGLTFKPNDPIDLSKKIVYLLCNRAKLDKLSKIALNIAKRYDYKKIAKRYQNYFIEVLKNFNQAKKIDLSNNSRKRTL